MPIPPLFYGPYQMPFPSLQNTCTAFSLFHGIPLVSFAKFTTHELCLSQTYSQIAYHLSLSILIFCSPALSSQSSLRAPTTLLFYMLHNSSHLSFKDWNNNTRFPFLWHIFTIQYSLTKLHYYNTELSTRHYHIHIYF